jgi:hypothetical protein
MLIIFGSDFNVWCSAEKATDITCLNDGLGSFALGFMKYFIAFIKLRTKAKASHCDFHIL